MTVYEALKQGRIYLEDKAIESPARNAEELLAFSSGLSRALLISDPAKVLSRYCIQKYNSCLGKRGKGLPLQYILGVEFFDDLTLKVGPGVLIPRPETELLTQEVRKRFCNVNQSIVVVDLGTGSGNIALSLAHYFKQARVIGVDKSEKALFWARKNKALNNIKNIRFYKGSAHEPVPRKYWNAVDIVVSNPPYIKKSDMVNLQKELSYEPYSALVGGTCGLKDIKKMIDGAKHLLKKEGMFFCEIGINQRSEVFELLQERGFNEMESIKDWQAIPRIIIAKYGENS